ncbi:hypothetical protein [Oceaniovalibus guishaninsula]|nr:hypothetical protein [Oceaniovalibus guishaninsula]
MPDIVVAPLFSRGFDSFDVARFLHHRGYRGMLRIVSAPLPRPDMVLSELRLAFPGLRMDIVTVTAAQAVRVA